MKTQPCICRKPAVLEQLQVSKSTLYQMIKNKEFPPPLKIGGRAVGWLQSDVTRYIEARAKDREQWGEDIVYG